jgi:general secretion pathway protein E
MADTRAGTSIVEALLRDGLLAENELKRIQALQKQNGLGVTAAVAELGLVAERDLAAAIARARGLPLAADDEFPEVPVADDRLSVRFLKANRICPLQETEASLIVALPDPDDLFLRKAIEMATGKPVEYRIATPSQIERALERIYEGPQSTIADIVEAIDETEGETRDENVERLIDLASETPIVRLVNLIIKRAIEQRASDIHIEPFHNTLKVRYRIDGVLQEGDSPPARSAAAVISRIKIMARLNIAERRLPQDGRIQLRARGKQIDLRVSTVPTLHGESVVLRILDKEFVPLDFAALGFDSDAARRLIEVLDLPHGILLVTGPTGSGKTTTLYAALQRLNTPDRKILTVEDPVEYQLDGINQIQVKPKIDLTFANALRSIVRQDPDIIMIGEMRDLETAGIAVQSALTGHLVLSTLHTNDAGSSITRLLDMGVEDYLLTSTINGIVAQRLVRTLCMACREAFEPLPELIAEWGLDRLAGSGPVRLYRAVGCDACAGTGYRGRTVIMEFLEMRDPIRRLVLAHEDGTAIERAAMEGGMRSMQADGVRKALAGRTTLEEVIRTTQEF